MKTSIHLLLSCGVLLFFTATSTRAQTSNPSQHSTSQSQTALSSLEREGDAVRMSGPHYRAMLRGGTFTYTPALGLIAPRVLPWAFELESIRRGEHVLWSQHAEGAQNATPSIAGRGARIERSEHIVETYDVRDDGVKQSFVFARLQGEGDLVVRGWVHSELEPRAVGVHSEVDYLFPEVGGIHLGAVLGIDAAGSTSKGTYRVASKMLEIVLPASFVDGAQTPLVLDPLVGSLLTNGDAARPDMAPSVSYEVNHDVYLTAWERPFAMDDVEIRGVLRNSLGQQVGNGLTLVSGGVNRNPDVSRLSSRQGFVVAYEHRPTFLSVRSIHAIFVRASDGAVLDSIVVSTSGDNLDPTVAGSGAQNAPGVLVAWKERDAGIRLRPVGVLSSFALALAPQVNVANASHYEHPSFSRSTSNLHALAYESHNTSQAKIQVRRFDATGSERGDVLSIEATGLDRTFPCVDGDGSRFRVVHMEDVVFGSDPQIREVQVEWDGAGAVVQTSSAFVAQTSSAEIEPCVCLLGPNYLVTWSHALSTQNREVHAMTRDKNACLPCGSEVVLQGSNASDAMSCIASRFASDPSAETGLIAWSSVENLPPFLSAVHMQRFSAFGGSALSRFTAACGNSPTITTQGTYAIGNSAFRLEMTTTDPGMLASFLLLHYANNGIPCGSCRMLNTTFIFQAVRTGATTAAFPAPIPCDPIFDGVDLYFQFASVGTPGATPCVLLPELSLTNVLGGTLRE